MPDIINSESKMTGVVINAAIVTAATINYVGNMKRKAK